MNKEKGKIIKRGEERGVEEKQGEENENKQKSRRKGKNVTVKICVGGFSSWLAYVCIDLELCKTLPLL